jgi:hypothetical protein
MVRKILRGAGFAVFLIALTYNSSHAQSLRGSRASVDRIHRQAVNHGLRFFPSASSIRNAHQDGELMRLGGNDDYTLVAVSYPYVLPEAYTFVVRLASQYRAACGEKLVVTSAARPTSMRLANSVDRSVHPTGMAIDLRKPTNSRCLRWLRSTLVALNSSGVLEAVEERSPPHFHVAVFPNQYDRYVQARTGGSRASATSLATVAAARSAASRTYQVRRGDSLWTIARRNNTTVERLRDANNLRTSRILAGQTLLIPTAR